MYSCTRNTMKYSELCFNFSCQLSELVRSHTRWVCSNFITSGLHRNSEWFLKYVFNKTAEFTMQKVYCLCLTLCDFIIISSDFVNSICQSLELSVPRAVCLDQYYALTNFWLFVQIKKADIKNSTISGLDTWCSDPSAGPLYSTILTCTMAVALNDHA